MKLGLAAADLDGTLLGGTSGAIETVARARIGARRRLFSRDR
ncbi:hypothetical protein PAESOLCIP111_02430 [Paenibacillus solanacearum]|uniref:Hydrolase n=1 Tax=Paenibacillus solanacearum TaxID=2048548 RepID=A0A916K467_9BACL|nr:hypothetical protein PAESOLCIP111_02430 [Paenibacillus solanacearum]